MQGISEGDKKLQEILDELNKVNAKSLESDESCYSDGYSDGILYVLQELGYTDKCFYREIHNDYIRR